MTERVKRLLDSMRLGEHEGVVVYDPSNMFYLSGYTGEGLVLVARGISAIITDFRYTEQAQAQAPGFEVLMTEKGKSHEDIAGALCASGGIDTLYYEDDFVTVHTFNALRESVRGVEWKVVGSEIARLREIKDEDELALIRQACRITGEAFERILPHIKEGVTEKELALRLDFDMMSHGASKPSFSTIVAAGANGSLPHAVPGEYRLRRGDMITMDFGARYGNYCADMTRTVALGQPSDEMKKVYGIVLDAQKMAQDAVAAGKLCRDIDAIARNYIYSHGHEGRFGHGLGHAVGIEIHENPRYSPTCSDIIQSGMVMTIEPGIYLPGKFGVRIEDTTFVRPDGCEIVGKSPKELIVL